MTLPPLDEVTEATDGARGAKVGLTVAADSFVLATNTPQLSGHEKYWVLDKHQQMLPRLKIRLPSNAAVIFPLACKTATQFDTRPNTRLSLNLAQIPQFPLVTERLDANVVPDFKDTVAFRLREDV